MLTLPQRIEPQDQGVDGSDPLLPMSLWGDASPFSGLLTNLSMLRSYQDTDGTWGLVDGRGGEACNELGRGQGRTPPGLQGGHPEQGYPTSRPCVGISCQISSGIRLEIK